MGDFANYLVPKVLDICENYVQTMFMRLSGNTNIYFQCVGEWGRMYEEQSVLVATNEIS